ncbi:invasion associated locus B family protein [Maritimibacter fusiformis]|uniref:Invasion associated locus B family protein n=1 Tax=Maritimibacter fusiformis TaxID=2603819 RepID=A0A5D0RPE2_9RHOB|nr:invasion associated locus B family protein [Maritimibacter fusiformis]TYB83457.1 invasion associated locus B family protein [Maritimibacter fusiformis]
MANVLKPLGLAALIALAGPALAQDDGLPPLDMGTDAEAAPAADGAAQEPPTYVDEVFDDWQRECLRLPEDAEQDDPCQITQMLYQEPGENPVGKITIGRLPAGGDAVAGSTIIVPLGTLIPAQLTLGVDSAAAKRYQYRFCESVGCVAQIGLTNADIAAFKAGKVANITVVPMQAPDVEVTLPASLKGFTAAYDSLTVPPAPAPAEEPAAQ